MWTQNKGAKFVALLKGNNRQPIHTYLKNKWRFYIVFMADQSELYQYAESKKPIAGIYIDDLAILESVKKCNLLTNYRSVFICVDFEPTITAIARLRGAFSIYTIHEETREQTMLQHKFYDTYKDAHDMQTSIMLDSYKNVGIPTVN